MKKNIKCNPLFAHESDHFDGKYSATKDIKASHTELFKWMEFYFVHKFIKLMGKELKGKSILLGCAGRAFEVPFLIESGMKVTLSDISDAACDYLKEQFPDADVLKLDFENTGLPEKCFDYVLVNKGLHHLSRPINGFLEMERLSREGFAFIEAQDSFPVRMIARHVIGEYENSGTYNYRFTKREIEKYLRSLNKNYTLVVKTAWFHSFGYFRNKLFPYIDNRKILVRTIKILHNIFNIAFGRCGNNMLCIVLKK